MTDIRCPMCGKSNPPELESCQYCQARLKPLNIGATPDQPDQFQADASEDSQKAPYDPGFPDWLNSFRDEDEFAQEQTQPDEALPDWLAADATETLGPSSPPTVEPSPSDWLESLRTESGEVGAEAPPGDQSGSWMPAENEEDLTTPDWLYKLRSTSEQDTTAAEDIFEPDDEPDWLKRFRNQKPDEEQQETEADFELPVDRALLAQQDTPTTPSASQPAENKFAPLPEEEEAEIPAWLQGLGEGGEDADLEELPEWLKRGETPPVDQTKELPVTAPFVFDYTADQVSGEPEPLEEEIPDWLAALQEKSGLEIEEPQPEMLEDLSTAAELPVLPGSGVDEGITPPFVIEEETETKVVQPFTSEASEEPVLEPEELPEWLKTESAEEKPAEIAEAEEVGEGLPQAALPAWLEAMRPVEVVAAAPVPDESERIVESSGPLAGLRGILRAEPDVARQHKPPAIPLKIQVSDANQAQIDLFQELLRQEGQPRTIPVAPRISQPFLLRLLVLILLLLGVGWPALNGAQDVALPQPPAEALMLRRLIDNLPNSEMVLVAVDYEPGLSGEMDAAASALLDHLMIKGSYLTFVSTLPNGPLQAERLLGILNQRAGHAYTSEQQYVNLGYIPGGSAGLLAFAETPRQVMPYSLAEESLQAWQATRLAQVQQLSDFTLVVVLTEDADTARTWVEQVQPAIGNTPLVLVSSAQAEPLLRPYFDSPTPQVSGMIAGLAGAAAYESTMPRQGLARRYWDAFSFGLGTALSLILVMSVVNIWLNLMNQRKQPEAKRRR